MYPGGQQGSQHGTALTDGQPQHRHINGRNTALGQYGVGDQIDAGHPAALFQQLGACRDPRLFDTVKVSVDTGMDGTQRNGGGQNADHRGCAGFQEQSDRYVVAARIESGSAGQGQGDCQQQTHYHGSPGGKSRVFQTGLSRYKFGDGSLEACGGQRKGQGQYGGQQLIDAHAFLPKKPGQIDAVEKSDNPGHQPGDGQDGGSHDQGVPDAGVGFFGR